MSKTVVWSELKKLTTFTFFCIPITWTKLSSYQCYILMNQCYKMCFTMQNRLSVGGVLGRSLKIKQKMHDFLWSESKQLFTSSSIREYLSEHT